MGKERRPLQWHLDTQGESWNSTMMTILIVGSKACPIEYLVFMRWHWEKYNPLAFSLWNQRTRCHPKWFVLICVCVPEYRTCTIDFELAVTQQLLKPDLGLFELHINKLLGHLIRTWLYPGTERRGDEDMWGQLQSSGNS